MTTDQRQTNRLLILDGHAILHRAWHALPPLSTKSGQVVSGAYGFVMTLLRAVREFHPTHLAVTFDLKEKTFRHEAYEDYKAGRQKQPEEFYEQVPIVEKILAQMNIPVFTSKGFEADDVIGTIVSRTEADDSKMRVVIVTGDLDTLQLVSDRTSVFTMRQGFTDTVTYGPAEVEARYGLKPEQMVDYKALRGDPSDNIPGVRGVGEKTASELIREFGSVTKLYESLDADDARAKALKPAVREKLIAGKKDAIKALDLCRIRRDVPIEFSLGQCEYRPVSRQRMTPMFEEYQFHRLLQQMPDDEGVAPKVVAAETSLVTKDDGPKIHSEKMRPESADAAKQAPLPERKPVKMLGTKAEVADFMEKMGKHRRIAFRTVFEDENPATPVIVAVGFACGKRTFFVEAAAIRADAARFTEWLSSSRRFKVCHDLKRELMALSALGVTPRLHGFFDLMLASYLYFAGERRHSLPNLLSFNLDVHLPEGQPADNAERLSRCADELPHFLPLFVQLNRDLRKYRLTRLNDEMELPTAAVLARMERAGVAVDVPYLRELSQNFGHQLVILEKKIYRAADGEFNINSPRQLSEVLFVRLKLSAVGLKKTAKAKEVSTAAGELEKLRGSHPVIEDILLYRELTKLKSTYVDALPELVHPQTGRIHANFNQAVTATGRLSSSNPNLQNIPTAETENGRLVRNAFVAPRGRRLLAFDYSQIELRIAAHIAKEKVMIRAFKAGEDIHWRTAAEMFGKAEADAKRRVAKVINFGILFGMGSRRLAESASIPLPEASEYIDRYFAVYRGIAAYIERTKEKLRRDGYVETLFGRRRFFFNYDAMNQREKAEAERQAINMPIQGTEADLIKLAMVSADKWLTERYGTGPDAPARLIIQVHDELVFEVEEKLVEKIAAPLAAIMENVKTLSVPVKVDVKVGKRWGEMEKIKV
ncbi:MAG: DNA polymerase I [Patescibacteria group bacterium]|nr:DNA polymerase I [Patescibacteria group bacterium]